MNYVAGIVLVWLLVLMAAAVVCPLMGAGVPASVVKTRRGLARRERGTA